jgi:hypothetical protein
MCLSEARWTERELREALDRYEMELRAAGKARNTITTYVQHPERFINWLVGAYRPSPTASAGGPGRSPGRRSRYDPLRQYLADRTEAVVRLTFGDVERILGVELPKSARQYRPWWANEEAGTHVHARAWLDAGRRTANVDLNAGTVEFAR